MNLLSKMITTAFLLLLLVTNLHAEKMIEVVKTPINETEFVTLFAGQTSEFIRGSLGEPEKIISKSNESGTTEFWLYKDIVTMGKDGKTFKYTQIGIINGYAETLGNTNRQPK